MEATIRIASKEMRPRSGLTGAIGGGTETAGADIIEVDLRDATGGDIALMLPEVAQAYVRAFNGIPFPEAGDPHPFGDRPEESETPESMSQGGTPIPDPDPTGEYPDGWHPAAEPVSQGGTSVDTAVLARDFIRKSIASVYGSDYNHYAVAEDITAGLVAANLLRQDVA